MQEQHPIPAPQRGVVLSFKAIAAVVGVLVIAAAIVVPLWVFVFTSSKKVSPPAQTAAPSIHFHYPKSWKLVKPSSVPGTPKNAAAVLERTGKTGVLVVLRSGPAKINNAEASKISSQLKAKYSDYHFLSAKAIKLPLAGRSMLFTYLRLKQGVLHTITIIPAGKISFVVETASPPKSRAIGKEIGKILRTAKLTYPSGK